MTSETGISETVAGVEMEDDVPQLKLDDSQAVVEPPEVHPAVAVALCSVLGFLFGLMMERSFVFAPVSIREQFTFQRFLMLKMFLSATISAQVGFIALDYIYPLGFKRASSDASSCGGMATTVLGAWLLGMGMSIAGACPGMVMQQIGANVPWGWLTFCGGVLGALGYGVLEPAMQDLRAYAVPPEKALHTYLGVSYAAIALPMMVALAGGVAVLEALFGWQETAEGYLPSPSGTSPLELARWPPILAGAVIGLLQVPFATIMGRTLGSSSAYSTAAAQWLCIVSDETRQSYEYMERFREGLLANFWQVIYLAGSLAGAAVGSSCSEPSQFGPDKVQGVTPAAALFGGFLMVFGSRMAEGCTSGHGLSGMPLLQVRSFVAVPAMFAGGIATGLVMKAAGVYNLTFY